MQQNYQNITVCDSVVIADGRKRNFIASYCKIMFRSQLGNISKTPQAMQTFAQ